MAAAFSLQVLGTVRQLTGRKTREVWTEKSPVQSPGVC
jgi:hypothetical protein